MNMENIQEAIMMMMDLRESYGIFCVNIVYPYIDEGKIMIRLIPTAMHTLDDVNYTIDALKKITENALAGKYKSNESLELNANNKEEDGEETNEE